MMMKSTLGSLFVRSTGLSRGYIVGGTAADVRHTITTTVQRKLNPDKSTMVMPRPSSSLLVSSTSSYPTFIDYSCVSSSTTRQQPKRRFVTTANTTRGGEVSYGSDQHQSRTLSAIVRGRSDNKNQSLRNSVPSQRCLLRSSPSSSSSSSQFGGYRNISMKHYSDDAASVIRSFIGTWILQPDRCQYEFGEPPESATYTIEALTDLDDINDVGDNEMTNEGRSSRTTTHELLFVMKWKERTTGEHFRTELTEAVDGRWHPYYGSGRAPRELAIDEISLHLQVPDRSSEADCDTDGDNPILVTYGRSAGKPVESTSRQLVKSSELEPNSNSNSAQSMKVTQSFFGSPDTEERKVTNISYFVRAYGQG